MHTTIHADDGSRC